MGFFYPVYPVRDQGAFGPMFVCLLVCGISSHILCSVLFILQLLLRRLFREAGCRRLAKFFGDLDILVFGGTPLRVRLGAACLSYVPLVDICAFPVILHACDGEFDLQKKRKADAVLRNEYAGAVSWSKGDYTCSCFSNTRVSIFVAKAGKKKRKKKR